MEIAIQFLLNWMVKSKKFLNGFHYNISKDTNKVDMKERIVSVKNRFESES